MNTDASFLVLFLAPVKDYLADDNVSEILINGPQQIYIERRGKLEETDAAFSSEAQLKAASAWLGGNPKNRKTDVRRFLANWLIREQDRAKTVAAPRYGKAPIDYAKVKADAEKLGDMWEDGE